MTVRSDAIEILALQAGQDNILAALKTLTATINAQSSAKVTAPKAPSSRKASRKGAKAGKASVSTADRFLTQKVRKDFIEAAGWGKGMSTRAIADAAIMAPKMHPMPAGWQIGEGYWRLVTGA